MAALLEVLSGKSHRLELTGAASNSMIDCLSQTHVNDLSMQVGTSCSNIYGIAKRDGAIRRGK
jgi:hypothetical protein